MDKDNQNLIKSMTLENRKISMAKPHIQEEVEDDLPDLPPFTRKSIGDLLMGEIINIFGNMLPKSMVEKYYIRRK